MIKIILSLAVILAAVEMAKHDTFLGALIIALPLTSMLSIAFLYTETQDATRASEYARDIFYLVPPSLLFFVPFLIASRTGWPFWGNFALGFCLLAGGMVAVRFLVK